MPISVTVIFLSIIFILIDIVPLYREQQWKIFFLYAALLGVTITLSLLMDFDIDIPSPADPLKKIISVIWGLK